MAARAGTGIDEQYLLLCLFVAVVNNVLHKFFTTAPVTKNGSESRHWH